MKRAKRETWVAVSVTDILKIKSCVTYQEVNCSQFKAVLGLFQAQGF